MTPEPQTERDDFVSTREIAKRWRVSEKTARVAIRAMERDPRFPRRDPLFGGKRYWPAVKAFIDARYSHKVERTAVQGRSWQEDFSYDTKRSRKNTRGARPAVARAQ